MNEIRHVPVDLVIRGAVVQVLVTDRERRDILRALEGHSVTGEAKKAGTLRLVFGPDVPVALGRAS